MRPKLTSCDPARVFESRPVGRVASSLPAEGKTVCLSYMVVAGMLILLACFRLTTPLVVVLFSYLALNKLHFVRRGGKTLALVLFLILVLGMGYGLGYFVNNAVRALPEIADKSIPSMIQWARDHQIQLPFTDYDSLKDQAVETVKSQVSYLGSVARIARGATTQFVLALIGCVVAISLFFNPRLELDREKCAVRNNLYSLCCDQIAKRFELLYQSFATVMGAQIIISAINTVFTAIFVMAVGLPHAVVVVGATFLCGLIPVVGNLISNTVIVSIGFTVSPKMALAALVFLVVIHKLEYFLNSKIIGQRIHNPLWLMLLALVLGEKLMGISGMILAPVVLNYIRMEASRIEMKHDGEPPVGLGQSGEL